MSFQRLPMRSSARDKSSLLSLFLSSKVRTSLWLAGTAMIFAATAVAQLPAGAHAQVLQLVDKDAANWQHVSKQIWDFAELGYDETRSSELLQEQLETAGFKVQAGVANEPTVSLIHTFELRETLSAVSTGDPTSQSAEYIARVMPEVSERFTLSCALEN